MTSDQAVTLEDVRIGGSRIVLEPHNCFACGSLNATGMHLAIHVERDRSWTELVLDRRFEGWDGIAHGGILCALLDEVMAWALVDSDHWGVTARIQVDFKRPVPIGRAIRGEGRVIEIRRRVVRTAGMLVDAADGTLLARAEGTFVAASDDQKQALKTRYGFRLERDAMPDTGDDDASDLTAGMLTAAGAPR